MSALTRSSHTTYCPYKGDAAYYSIPVGGTRSINAVWTYETPFEAMTIAVFCAPLTEYGTVHANCVAVT